MTDENDYSKFDPSGDNYILPDGKLLSAEQMEEKLAAEINKCTTQEEREKAQFLYASFLLETAKPFESTEIFNDILDSSTDEELKNKCHECMRLIIGDAVPNSEGIATMDDEEVYERLTKYFSAVGNFLTAVAYFKKASTEIKDSSRMAAVHLALGSACERRGRYEEAIGYYSGAFLLPAGSDETWYFLNNNIGYSLMREKQFTEAEAYCREAIRIDPKRHNAHKNLALSLQGQGRIPEAVREFVSSVQRNPVDPRAFDHLKEMIESTPDIEEKVPDINAHLWECHKAIAMRGGVFTGPNDPKLMTIPPFPPNAEEQEWIENSLDPTVAYFAFRFALAYNTLSPEYLWGMISKDSVYERQTPLGTETFQGGERIFDRWARIIYEIRDKPDKGHAVLELGRTADDRMPGVIFYESYSDIQQDWMDRSSNFIRFQCNPAGRMTKGWGCIVDPPQKLPVRSGLFPGLKSEKLKPVPISFKNGRGIRFVLYSSDVDETDISGDMAAEHVNEVVSRLDGSIFIRININSFDEEEAGKANIHPGIYDIRDFPSVIILAEDKILFRLAGLDRIKNMSNEISKVFLSDDKH